MLMFINRFALYQNLQKRKIENCIGLLTFITKLNIGSLFSLFLVSANQNKETREGEERHPSYFSTDFQLIPMDLANRVPKKKRKIQTRAVEQGANSRRFNWTLRENLI